MQSTIETLPDGATPERILESARALFLANGVSRTRMSDIAEGAGVVRQTVYDWVSNKAEIVELAMAARVHELGVIVKATPVDQSLPLPDRLMRVLITMVELAASDPEAEVLAQSMPEQRAYAFLSGPSALTEVVEDILVPYFEEAAERGLLRDDLGTRAIAEWVQLVAGSMRYRVADEQEMLPQKLAYFLLPAILRDRV